MSLNSIVVVNESTLRAVAMTGDDGFAVKLIKRLDGEPMGPRAYHVLSKRGAFFDTELRGFVMASIPRDLSFFISANGLGITHACVCYDLAWFSTEPTAFVHPS